MPAKGQTNPVSRRTRLREHFANNRGRRYRAREVAADLGDKTQPVANELARMARDGEVVRERLPVEGRAQPITLYRAVD